MQVFPLLPVLLLLASLGAADPSPTTELVGLTNLSLRTDERLWQFEIELNEGRVIAVCNIPDGWTITAQSYGEGGLYKDGGGRIRGTADVGHDALSRDGLSQLSACVLIDRSLIHAKRATLSGSVTFDGPGGSRKVALRSENFYRRPAVACSVQTERRNGDRQLPN